MGEESPVHRYYYSTYHLAGDFVWGIGIASLFLTLASILVPEVQAAISAAVDALDRLRSTSLVIAGIGLYALIMAALSMIAHRISSAFRDTFRSLPGRHQSIGYKAIYERRKDDIATMYRQHFPDGPDLSVRSALSPTEMVNRLSALMKIYNPEGYNHNYRTYTIVTALRQSILYTITLVLLLVARSQYWAGGFLLIFMTILFTCLRFAAEQSVATEFDFIVATSRWTAVKGKACNASSQGKASAEDAS